MTTTTDLPALQCASYRCTNRAKYVKPSGSAGERDAFCGIHGRAPHWLPKDSPGHPQPIGPSDAGEILARRQALAARAAERAEAEKAEAAERRVAYLERMRAAMAVEWTTTLVIEGSARWSIDADWHDEYAVSLVVHPVGQDGHHPSDAVIVEMYLSGRDEPYVVRSGSGGHLTPAEAREVAAALVIVSEWVEEANR